MAKANSLKGAGAPAIPAANQPLNIDALKAFLASNPEVAREVAKVATVRSAAKQSDRAEVTGLALTEAGEHLDATVKIRFSREGRATVNKKTSKNGEPTGWTYGSFQVFVTIDGEPCVLYGALSHTKSKAYSADNVMETVG